ncbi:MAG TPA: hypothetical protein VGJ37_05415 [Pyrinomonadaceae bacterium]|jgi:hypothetical protein
MKQGRNSEIDLLLRRLSRRDGNGVHDTELDDGHLDADELSVYAQNAAPPAARARYIEHLAECATCRRLAAELSLSLGATTAAQVETVAAPGWLKQFLASLFSPMVLRYAVPALGVIVVMVVGFVVLRQQRAHEFARVNSEPKAVVPEKARPEAPVSGYSSPEATPSNSPQQRSENGTTKPVETKPEKETIATDTARGAAQPLAKADRGVAELQPGTAAAAPPAAPKAAPAESDADKKAEDAAKKEPGAVAQTVEIKREQAKESTRDDFRRSNDVAANEADQSKTKAAPSQTSGFMAGRARAAAPSGTQETKRAEESKDNANNYVETRSIAGRQFRKERGIWIDTAYDSSTATVNMARSSEQFRALVADEPVIGTIAKQLDGEVIVVWKGRAYRIR